MTVHDVTSRKRFPIELQGKENPVHCQERQRDTPHTRWIEHTMNMNMNLHVRERTLKSIHDTIQVRSGMKFQRGREFKVHDRMEGSMCYNSERDFMLEVSWEATGTIASVPLQSVLGCAMKEIITSSCSSICLWRWRNQKLGGKFTARAKSALFDWKEFVKKRCEEKVHLR